MSYLYIFFQSNAIEVLFALFLYKRQFTKFETAALVTLANSMTHPIVFFGFLAWKLSYLEAILWAEAFAVVIEGFLHSYFGRISLIRAFGVSLLINVASWQIAPLLTYYFIHR